MKQAVADRESWRKSTVGYKVGRSLSRELRVVESEKRMMGILLGCSAGYGEETISKGLKRVYAEECYRCAL